MKFISIISMAFLLLVSCNSSNSTPDAPPPSQLVENKENPSAPVDTMPKSPFQNDIAFFQNSTQQFKYTYAEALDRVDGTVELRFYTIAPVGMCNLSTFTDSSFYQTHFSYLRLRFNKLIGKILITNSNFAEVGARGDDFPVINDLVAGEIFISSIKDNIYQGWVNLIIAQTNKSNAIQGNFKVVNCTNTYAQLKNMDLHELYYKSVTLKNISGEEHKIQISSSYSKWNYSSSYNGYLTEVYDRVSFQIMAASGEPRDFDNEFSGNIAGNFISAGNTSCLKGSSGSAVAEIVGNTLYFNQGLNNRLHFCKYSETLMRYSGQIEYFPVTGIRKITINHPRGNFVGSF